MEVETQCTTCILFQEHQQLWTLLTSAPPHQLPAEFESIHITGTPIQWQTAIPILQRWTFAKDKCNATVRQLTMGSEAMILICMQRTRMMSLLTFGETVLRIKHPICVQPRVLMTFVRAEALHVLLQIHSMMKMMFAIPILQQCLLQLI